MVALSLKVIMFTLFQIRALSQSFSLPMDSALPEQDLRSASQGSGSLGTALRGSGIVVSEQVEKTFLLEVEAALGAQLVDRSRDRMADIMKGLRPMFESLDKNEYGKLGHTAVRYALHRLFVARHGWLMKGLDPAGQHFNSSSPVLVLQGKASAHLQDIFEARLGGQGFGLQELAVFASVLETLISAEALGRLKSLYQKLALPLDARLSADEVDNLVELYMTAYILGKEIEDTSQEDLMEDRKQMPGLYSFWAETQKLLREVRMEVLGKGDQHSLEDMSGVLVQIGERFGKWQNAECQVMKKKLINLETDEKGCVPLSSFYKGHVTSGGDDWQFGESIDYLKQNGILDTSDPGNMKVMVANYMYAPANWIASSHYYAVGCIDECDSLFGHIERQVRGTTASPNEIATMVAALPSNTVAANRTLSSSQFHRLFRIAEMHGGRVPIHGRLFMQWMHMVYPRECAYPHMSGTTRPLSPDAWLASTNKDPTATNEEMRSFVNAPAQTNQTTGDQGQCGRWVEEEELYVGPTSRRLSIHELETDMHTWLATTSVALLCFGAVAILALIQTLKSMKNAFCGDRKVDRSLMLV